MSENYILTFDCGTQSVRAMLFDAKGNLAAMDRQEFTPYFSLAPGWAEQDPELYWQKICAASLALKQKAPEQFAAAKGVVLTTMRDTCVNLDKSMKPLRPAILWVDQRRARCEKPLPPIAAAKITMAGMTDCVDSSRKASKSNWIIENEPEIWARTAKYVMLSCWLTYRFTGRLTDSLASQVGHVPFDYKKLRWMPKSHYKWGIFQVEPDKLPALTAPGAELGRITDVAAAQTGIAGGLPMIAAGGDKGCETLGSGAITPDVCSISYGTTSTIQLTTDKYVEPQQFLPAYPALLPGCYNPEIEIYRGYWMVTWFKEQFAKSEAEESARRGVSTETVLDEKMALIPPGSDGLILQPYWGPGLKNPEAKGAIIGFCDTHTGAHMYRAIVEGIAYALREAMDTLARRADTKISRLTVAGGGASSDAVCQITADVFGLPVQRAQTPEAAGLGASIAGFAGLGIFPDAASAAKAMVRYESVFLPEPRAAQIYDRLYREIYLPLYSKLRPLYHKMREIYSGRR